MTLANPSQCHCDKFEPSEEVLEIARNGELQRRYEKLLEAKAKEAEAKEILRQLHKEEEQQKEAKNLRKEAELMRKRNKKKEKGVRNEEEKKKAGAQKKSTEKQNAKDTGMPLFSKTPPPKLPPSANHEEENSLLLLSYQFVLCPLKVDLWKFCTSIGQS